MIWTDLDNTLVFVRDPRVEQALDRSVALISGRSPDDILRLPRKGRRKLQRIVVAGVDLRGCVRRGAHEFLTALRMLGEVRMMTSANKPYALAINKEFKLGFKRGQIFSWEDWRSTLQTGMKAAEEPDGILIDNRSDEGNQRHKLGYLGRLSPVVLVDDFTGYVDDNFAEKWPGYLVEVQKHLGRTHEERVKEDLEQRARNWADLQAAGARLDAQGRPGIRTKGDG